VFPPAGGGLAPRWKSAPTLDGERGSPEIGQGTDSEIHGEWNNNGGGKYEPQGPRAKTPPLVQPAPPLDKAGERKQTDELRVLIEGLVEVSAKISNATTTIEKRVTTLEKAIIELRISCEGGSNEIAVRPIQPRPPMPDEEPPSVDLDELAAEVIKRLPPRRFQAKDSNGVPYGNPITKGWTDGESDILYFQSELEPVE